MRSRVVLALALAAQAVTLGPAGATFSIVARDAQTGEIGVAVESRAFSVGSAVPWAEAGVGGIATQARTNDSFGPLGLGMLREGAPAESVVARLLAADSDASHRQLGVVDDRGGAASRTGSGCSAWAGDTTGSGLAIQGNILAGPQVVREMARAFTETEGELSLRLLAALEAGQAAGGDRRGQQSAALLVVRPSERYPEYRYRYVDLRVEDHPQPIRELVRLFRIQQAGDLLRAHLRYAAEFDSAGRPEAAGRELARVGETLAWNLEAGTEDPSVLNALAWNTAVAGIRLEEALRAAERAVEGAPDSPEILDTLAEVRFRLGDRGGAVEAIDRALRLSPEDSYLRGQRERFLRGPIPERAE